MKTKRGFHHIKQRDFDQIKYVVGKLNAKPSMVSKLTGRSVETIARIMRSNTLADYRNGVREYNTKYRASKSEIKPVVQVISGPEINKHRDWSEAEAYFEKRFGQLSAQISELSEKCTGKRGAGIFNWGK